MASERCACCSRPRSGESAFCQFHRKAYTNLVEGFKAWRSALPSVGVEGFLQKMLELDEVGRWAMEISQMLLNDEEARERFASEAGR